MSTALMERDTVVAPLVTAEQLELVKHTVANGATDAELKLYLYDCARQGVHPLDRLIHFTKRGGKYTPITSIDFMRTRAADTNEYAGSDDAVFSVCQHCGGENLPGPDVETFAARVTVWRLVQGQRCSFTATARWSEYCPAAGQDHMWKKMPHTMLAKCAEALALRKGFPRQLAGLYAKEELDQSSIDAPAPITISPTTPEAPPIADRPEPPAGFHYIHGYKKDGEWHEFSLLKWDQQGGSFKFSTKRDVIGDVIRQAYQDGVPIKVTNYTAKKNSPREGYLNTFETLKPAPSEAELDAEAVRTDQARAAGKIF